MKSLKTDFELLMNQTFDHMEEMEAALRGCIKVITDMRKGDRFYDDEADALDVAQDVLEKLQ